MFFPTQNKEGLSCMNIEYRLHSIITMASASTGSFPIYHHRLFNFPCTTHSSISLITLNFPHRTTTTTISTKPFNLIPQLFNPSFSFNEFHEFQEEEEEEEEQEEEYEEEEYEEEEEEDPKVRLFLGNLPFTLSSSQLDRLFRKAGNVVSVEVSFHPFHFFLSFFLSYMRKLLIV